MSDPLSSASHSLRVQLDGVALPPEQARAVWTRFSLHMDANQGDFDGFAAAEGCRSARVAVEQGKPTLHLSKQPATPAAAPAGQRKRRGKRRRRGGGGRG